MKSLKLHVIKSNSIILIFWFLFKGTLQLFKGCSALGTLWVYFSPTLNALTMKEVFALSVNRMKTFFVSGQANWTNLFSLNVLGDIIEFVCFSALGRNRIFNWIFIVEWFKQSYSSQVFFSFFDQPLLDLETSQGKKIVFPCNVLMKALNIEDNRNY